MHRTWLAGMATTDARPAVARVAAQLDLFSLNATFEIGPWQVPESIAY